MNKANRLISCEEAASKLHLASPCWLRKELEANTLPGVHVGDSWFMELATIEAIVSLRNALLNADLDYHFLPSIFELLWQDNK